MSVGSSLDQRDRTLLLGCGALVILFIIVLALFSPASDNQDPTPSSYSTTPHGAKAAYELLGRAGYQVERQTDALSEITYRVDDHVTVVITEPYLRNVTNSQAAVKAMLENGARVLVTGFSGGWLVPEGAPQSYRYPQPVCTADPNGLQPLAASGTIHIAPEAHWNQANPLQNVAYNCQGDAVAVTYKFGKGTVVWWANSLPLENAGIQQADNLVFFLNSIGPRGTHVFWDESLHGDAPSLLSYAKGTPLTLALWQGVLVASLLVWSYGRRSGPLRPDPVIRRATPIEFVHSLGSLYEASGASQTAVNDAYQQFRQKLERQTGIPQSLPAAGPQMTIALRQHFGAGAERLEQALLACEQAAEPEKLSARSALTRIQALHDCQDVIDQRMQIHPAQPGTQTWKKTPNH
jgi:hypothetical protein